MPIMNRMRENMPIMFVVLAALFLVMIIFEWGMDYTGRRSGAHGEVIGVINGKQITYPEFSEVLRTATENQKAQTGKEPVENQLPMLRQQVWESMVTQELINEQLKKLDITVTDQELNNWVRGDNPPEDLKRNFIDSTGNFRRDIYEQFLNNPNQVIRDPQGADPAFGTKWLVNYEKNLRQRRAQEKLQSVVLASVRVTPGEVLQKYNDQNTRYRVLYSLLDASQLVKDDEVQVSDVDLRKYYDENIDQFKFEASRKLQYVAFPEKPSHDDTAGVENDIQNVASQARSGVDFLQLVHTYSETPDSGTYFRHGELSQPLENAVFSGHHGDVIGPILDKNIYYLMKILDERKSSTEYVRASHILLSLNGTKDSNDVKSLARDIMKELRGGADFATLAQKYSEDPGSAAKGGDLGWFTRGRMVKPFEEAAFAAKPGELVGPIRTSFGLHIIKVTGKDSREVKIASVRMTIRISQSTKDDLMQRASDFAYNARQSGFAKEAQATGFTLKETEVNEKGGVIPGVGQNENVVKWAFSEGAGSVSEPFSLTSSYAVFSIEQVINAGVKPFDEVKQSISAPTLQKKKVARVMQIAADLKSKLGSHDSLTAIQNLDPRVKVEASPEFTLSTGVPGLGREPHFLGAVSALTIGQISPPVETYRGAFLIQLLYRSEFDSTKFEAQKSVTENQLLQEKRNRFLSEWLAKLKESADIEDNRHVFFR